MNTKQYHYISTIASYGNLTHAAQALHISPSALSKFLAECERTFGFTLFLRYNRRLYPTAVGRYVIDCAQKIEDEKNRMLLTMKDVTGGNCNRIRLATAPNRGAIIYSKIYNQFSRRFPGISLTLTELYAVEQPTAIARGSIDLALGAGVTSTQVTDLPVAHEELLVSLPVAHPLAGQERIRLKDLKDTPFVLQGRRHSIRLLAEQLFQQAGFEPVIAFESNDVLLLDSMMHQAVGVGLVSKAHVTPCEELVYRPLDPPVYQTLHLRFPLGHTLSEPERYLAGLLAAERLSDPRYQAAKDPFVQTLLQTAASPSVPSTDPDHRPSRRASTAPQETADIDLDIKVMEYLISIVDEQSLSRAADKHFLAQSALSRHLRNVETLVGMPLFTREHNRLRPTSAGAVFVNNARNILRLENEMFAQTRSYQQGHGGSLYIHCDPLFAQAFRQRAEQAFRAAHPEITLVVAEANQEQTLEALMNSTADLGIFLSHTPEHALLHCDVLTLTEMVYCFVPGGCPDGWKPGELLPSGFVLRPQLMAQSHSTLRAEQDALLATLADPLPPAACEAQVSILRQLANLGIADAVLPLNLIERQNHDRCAAFDPPRPLYLLLAHHVGRTMPAVTQELMDLIRQAMTDVLAIPA